MNVTVSAIYRPAPGEVYGKLGPHQFTAGSDITLNCSVCGHSGSLSYIWSVSGNPNPPGDCSKCEIPSSTTPTLKLGIYSFFAGVYTCTVSGTGVPHSQNSDKFTVTVVGEPKILFS